MKALLIIATFFGFEAAEYSAHQPARYSLIVGSLAPAASLGNIDVCPGDVAAVPPPPPPPEDCQMELFEGKLGDFEYLAGRQFDSQETFTFLASDLAEYSARSVIFVKWGEQGTRRLAVAEPLNIDGEACFYELWFDGMDLNSLNYRFSGDGSDRKVCIRVENNG